MNGVLEKIGAGLKKFGVAVKDVVTWIPSHIAKLERVLKAEKAVAPELREQLKTTVADIAAFSAAVAVAVNEKGLIWTHDVAAVMAAEKVAADLPGLVDDIETAFAALEN